MSKIANVFKSMDETIFKGIEEVKAQPAIQKFIDELNARSEEQQKVINHLLSIFAILLPIFITLFIYWQNVSLKSEIETRQFILKEVAENAKKKNQLDLTGRSIIGPGEIRELSDLQRLVRSSLSSRGVTPDNLTVTDFSQVQAGEGLTQTSATLNFSGFSTQELTGLFQDLIQRQKVKISAIQIEKKEQKNLLEGSFQIYHFSKLEEDGE